MKCDHCGYEWTPRKEEPKYCPICKRPLFKFSSRRLVRELGVIKQSQVPNIILCNAPGCSKVAMYALPGEKGLCLEHLIEFINSQRQITHEELLNQKA